MHGIWKYYTQKWYCVLPSCIVCCILSRGTEQISTGEDKTTAIHSRVRTTSTSLRQKYGLLIPWCFISAMRLIIPDSCTQLKVCSKLLDSFTWNTPARELCPLMEHKLEHLCMTGSYFPMISPEHCFPFPNGWPELRSTRFVNVLCLAELSSFPQSSPHRALLCNGGWRVLVTHLCFGSCWAGLA